jgi:beta-glucosidase
MQSESYAFPKDFLWGAAASAYQIEGAANEGGRGPSIWDEFCRRPGAVKNGQSGERGVDHYHRFREDVALLKAMGVKAYRFSVSWPRVQPDGEGAVNETGLKFYEELVDALLAAGIEPWLNLFHWDLPLPLQTKYGGWQSRKTVEQFGKYAEIMSKRLSDRVRRFLTVNELFCMSVLGHEAGIFAPGLKLTGKAAANVRHNSLLAHGRAVAAIREHGRKDTEVGLVENPTCTVPAIETPEYIEAARRAFKERNAPFMSAILGKGYMDSYLAKLGAGGPDVQPGDFDLIGAPLDFVGANIYSPEYVAPGGEHGFRSLPFPSTYPTYGLPWLKLGPSAIYWVTRFLVEHWGVERVYISENGCCCEDAMAPDGEIYDIDRILYLRENLKAAHRAVSEGLPLKGYFVWSFIDNFEWAEGYSKRFGLTWVNYETMKRVPKMSAKFYSEVIRNNRVV